MKWVRGATIGRGSFATVSLAVSTTMDGRFPPFMAVKTCGVDNCDTLKNERDVLSRLGDCQDILRCYGDEYGCEGRRESYNVLLEYASGGSLADHVKKFGGLSESDVRRYTRSVLRGLDYVHRVGYVHCDVKLQNLLLCSEKDSVFRVKIGDFGLAKKAGKYSEKKGFGSEFRGTPMYMSPECLTGEEQNSDADIWALGCAVVEMVSGKPAWRFRSGTDVNALLYRIWNGKESPEIPTELSEAGKDFLGKCFARDPKKRWTAEMLLDHPFVAVDDVTVPFKQSDEASISPRSPFDFPEWASDHTPSPMPESVTRFDGDFDSPFSSSFQSPIERIRQLVIDQTPIWLDSETWVTVR